MIESLTKEQIPDVFESILKASSADKKPPGDIVDLFAKTLIHSQLSAFALTPVRSVEEMNFTNRRVLLRADFDGSGGHRLRQAVVTMKKALNYGARVILVSHAEAGVSFSALCDVLQGILDKSGKVTFCPDIDSLSDAVSTWTHNDVILLENLSECLPGDSSSDDGERLMAVRCFTPHIDVYVWEAFS